MNNRKKRNRTKSKRTKSKSKKRRRKSGRMVNFMGTLLLEICGMVLLLTLFFASRESPAEFEARITNHENEVELVQPAVETGQFESLAVRLFEKRR